jgi:hypothetical protein
MILKTQVHDLIRHQVKDAMLHRKTLTMVVEEVDGEHTVEGLVIGYLTDSNDVQITNEWGHFQIPLHTIVRIL